LLQRLKTTGHSTRGQLRILYWDARSCAQLRNTARHLGAALQRIKANKAYHLVGRGGTKAALRMLIRHLPHANFVARFDIKHYYQSMNHHVIKSLLQPLNISADDALVMDQFLQHAARHTQRGIPAGNAVAPILGALMLAPLDQLMHRLKRSQKIISYVRYMDDIVILTKTRWQLRRAIKKMYAMLEKCDLTVHQDQKRSIGRTRKGFDFLGYRIYAGKKLTPSKESVRRFQQKMMGLMSKEPDRLYSYIARWHQALYAGLSRHISHQGGLKRTKKRALYYLKQQGYSPP